MCNHQHDRAFDIRIIRASTGARFPDFREMLSYKDLLWFLVWRDVKTLYSQSVLGVGWAIVRPVFSAVIFSVVFGALAHVPSDGVPYTLFSFTGLLPWTYFSTAMSGSANSLVNSANVLNKVYFPRIFIPLTPVLAGLVDLVVAGAVLVLVLIGYHHAPTASIAYLPLLILIMVLTAFGAGLWLSALAIQYRDIRYAVGFLTQLLLYAAPVVWPVSLINQRFGASAESFRLMYGIFPMVGVIEGFRAAVLGSGPMPWDLIAIGAASAIVFVTTGLAYFRRRESFFADVA